MSKNLGQPAQAKRVTELFFLVGGLVAIYGLLSITVIGTAGGPVALVAVGAVLGTVARFATTAPRVLRLLTMLFAGASIVLAVYLIWAHAHGYH